MVCLYTKHYLLLDTSLDIPLKLLENRVSLCVMSDVGREVANPLQAISFTTNRGSVSKNSIRGRLPWWWLSVDGFGSPNRFLKPVGGVVVVVGLCKSQYEFVVFHLFLLPGWRAVWPRGILKALPAPTFILEIKRSFSCWPSETFSNILEKDAPNFYEGSKKHGSKAKGKLERLLAWHFLMGTWNLYVMLQLQRRCGMLYWMFLNVTRFWVGLQLERRL